MRFSTAVAFAFSAATTLVAAQDSCQAQNIVDACVEGYQARITGCQKGGNDYICLCDVYRDVLTCYNNCPDSSDKPPVENQVTQFCLAADPLRSASMSSRASAESVAATATTNSPASTAASTTAAGSNTASGSSPTASAFSTNAATTFGAPAGAAIAAIFGVAGLL